MLPKRALIVQGMAFGDEGKGATVDWLVRRHRAPLVVRYNGGPQAAHNVVTPEGLHHTFAQFGAGTLAGADTYYSRYALLDPLALHEEAACLRGKIPGGGEPYDRFSVNPEAVVITRYQVAANRALEIARGARRHGSVGAGVGEARRDQVEAGLTVTARMARRGGQALVEALSKIRGRKLLAIDNPFVADCPEAWEAFDEMDATPGEVAEEIVDAMRRVWVAQFPQALDWSRRANPGRPGTVVFEGAQGFLLDEEFGFAPYNSWTDCTFTNAECVLREYGIPERRATRVGVFRSYFTRHGPGPFPTEDEALQHPEPHNGSHPWMGPFRQGHFDLHLAAYAAVIADPDCLVVTHMDRARAGGRVCVGYEPAPGFPRDTEGMLQAKPAWLTDERRSIPELLAQRTGCPVAALSRGPTHQDFEATKGGPP